MRVRALHGMLVWVVWSALALGARADSTGAWSATEHDELSTVPTARALVPALPPDAATSAEEEPDLYTDTTTDTESTGAWSATERDQLSSVATARALVPVQEPDLYPDTTTDTESTASELPTTGAVHLPAYAVNYSLARDRGLRRSKYVIDSQLSLEEVLFHQRAHRMKFEGSTGMMLLVVVILPGILFLVVFLVIIANTATPMKVPYANTKEGIVPPWMMHEYTVENVKCYPTYGQV